MARLFRSGFELNSLTTGVEFTSIQSTPTIDSSVFRTGLYALKVSSLASGTAQSIRYQFIGTPGSGNGPYWARAYLNVTTFPSAGNLIIGFRDTNASVTRARIVLNTTGTLELQNSGGTRIGSVSAVLSTGTWYRIEMKIDVTPASGSQILEARLNGFTFATSSAQTIAAGVDTIQIGGNIASEAQTQGVWYFDDVAVNDSSSTFQNTYPGSGGIILLHPDSTGDSNGFLTQVGGTAGSTNNFTRVNEVTPDDATSYNGSNLLNAEDLFNCGPCGISSSSTINEVAVGCRIANITGADATAAIKLEIEKTTAGTKAQSSNIVPNSTTWITNGAVPRNYPLITYQDPDSVNWTPTTLDSMQIGYIQTVTNTRIIAVSTIWASIDFSAPSSSSNFFMLM